jgi:type IV secretory pathway VirB4 component
VAVLDPRQCLRQRAPAHRLDLESCAHDAGVGGLGGPGAKRPLGRTTLDRHPHRWCDTVPAGHAHRRVGHTLVVGPTGMGKSVLLATMAMQFRRYRGSRIFAFDMGRSMRATILGLGGEHYDLGTDGSIAFQPLAHIDQESYRTWAAEWIEGRLTQEGVIVGPAEKEMVWSALNSLASAPVEQRTMTGLSVLLQSNALRQALQPYVLGGAHGKLLDADQDRLGNASVQCFEMEELMHSKAAVLAVLTYLFAHFDERFDGAPTLLILDEAWLFLDDPVFAARIRQWLKTLRKKNVSVIFSTQSLADIKDSTIAPAIVESCASRIFLPNSQATEPQIRTIYEGFGLNTRQIEIVAHAQPKRDYYYQSRVGNRVFDLGLGPVALAFAGASTPEDQRAIDQVHDEVSAAIPPSDFATAWLHHRGLHWAADLMPSFPARPATSQESSP